MLVGLLHVAFGLLREQELDGGGHRLEFGLGCFAVAFRNGHYRSDCCIHLRIAFCLAVRFIASRTGTVINEVLIKFPEYRRLVLGPLDRAGYQAFADQEKDGKRDLDG